MLVQRVQQQFIDSADVAYQCADALGAAVDAAIGAILATITGGGKVLVCGVGSGSALAQLMVNHLLHGLERDRPMRHAPMPWRGTLPRWPCQTTCCCCWVRRAPPLAWLNWYRPRTSAT